jgi:hypothetical protein
MRLPTKTYKNNEGLFSTKKGKVQDHLKLSKRFFMGFQKKNEG